MKDESEPIGLDENLIRLIWTSYFKLDFEIAVQERAFLPRNDEIDGISLFRDACLKSPLDSLEVIADAKREKYGVALLPVSELVALGLRIEPSRIDKVPGHVLLADLNCSAFKEDKARWQKVQQQLAVIASRNVVRHPMANS